MNSFRRKTEIEPHECCFLIFEAETNATIGPGITDAYKSRPLVDVSSICKDGHLERLGHRPPVFGIHQRGTVSIEPVAVVAARVVRTAQCRLQIKRDLIVALDRARFVAGAERKGAHPVGESEIVFRLRTKQIEGIRVVRLVPERCESR